MDVTELVALCLFTFIFTIGVPGNCMVVWVFARKSRKSTTSLLILGLAVIDLGACLIAPVHLVRALGGRFIDTFVCKFSIYGSRAFSFSALYLTICIAIDRYRAICRPLKIRLNTRRARVVSIGLILVSIGLATSGNVQYALYVKPVEIGFVQKCIYRGGPDWLDLSNEIFTSISYIAALVICTGVYVRIYQRIRKQMKVRAGLVENEATFNTKHSGNNRPTIGNCAESSTSRGSGTGPWVTPVAFSMNQGKDAVSGVLYSCSDGGSGGITSGIAFDNSTKQNPPKERSNRSLLQLPERDISGDIISTDNCSCPRPITQNNSKASGRTQPIQQARQQAHRNRMKKERLMTRMLLGTNLVLILSWLPSFILTQVPDDAVAAYRAKESQGIVVSFSYQLRNLNHIVSIFVYALLNSNFRKDCMTILVKLSTLRRP